MLTFGLIINPFAGLGGAVGLKGSDGVAEQALALGATPKAIERTRQALTALLPHRTLCRFITCAGGMGERLLTELGFEFQLVGYRPADRTTAEDTRIVAEQILTAGADVLVFAGGDGTARDICAVVGEKIPVLGIPAGVKIHSSVYGITPAASGEVLVHLLQGQLVDIREAEVRDLDEDAFRNNQVRARHYGDMRVPQLGHFVQAVKQGGVESEALVHADIAACIAREMEDDVLYLIGSGKTTQAIMEELGLESTLLGVDAVFNHQLLASDLNENALWHLLQEYPQANAIVSTMGGQGHVFGRGNQQFSPRVLRRLGKDRITVVSTKTKLTQLEGRPLVIDSGDPELDKAWGGTLEVLTGYEDRVVYPLV